MNFRTEGEEDQRSHQKRKMKGEGWGMEITIFRFR